MRDEQVLLPLEEQAAPPRPARLYPLALAVAVWLAYHNGLTGVFVFDDGAGIVRNRALRQPCTISLVSGRPVLDLTLALNYAAGGLDVRGYHLVNVGIHVLAALVLYGVVRRTLLLPGWALRFGRRAHHLALAAAALWALHPLQTESVTYVIQRAESLVGLWYLLLLYCLARTAEAGAWRGWPAAAVVACTLGMGTKQVMATAPLVALLYDRTFLAGGFAGALRARRWAYAGMAASWVWLACFFVLQEPSDTAGFGVVGITWWRYLLTQAGVLTHYLRLAVWPDVLVLDYGWPLARSWHEAVVPGLAVLSLLCLSGWQLVRRTAVGFLGAFFFLVLLPTSSFVPILDAAVEHRMYLPLAAPCVLAVVAADEAAQRWCGGARGRAGDVVLFVALLAACGGLAHRTALRNEEYQDKVALCWSTVLARPGNARAWAALGIAFQERESVVDAQRAYRECLLREPGFAVARYRLGFLLAAEGRMVEAASEFERGAATDPYPKRARARLGVLRVLQGDVDGAIPLLEASVRERPDEAMELHALASALSQRGRLPEAVALLEHAAFLEPSHLAIARELAGARAALAGYGPPAGAPGVIGP